MEYEENEQQQGIYPQQVPTIGHTSEGALQYQLESLEAIDKIEHVIKGEVEIFNEETGRVEWKQQFEPMINQKGINMIRGYLAMYMGSTKTYALTKLNSDYVSQEVIDVGRNIKAELMDNWNDYGVKDYSSASFIMNIITSAVNAILHKGEDATYLKFLRTTQNIFRNPTPPTILTKYETAREIKWYYGIYIWKEKNMREVKV